MPKIICFFSFFFILWSCQGPPEEVQFPTDQNEFPQPTTAKFKMPAAKTIFWQASPNQSKPGYLSKIYVTESKDSVFRLESFVPVKQPLDSHVIKLHDLPSVPLSLTKLEDRKLHPSIIILGTPQKTKALQPIVETMFTRGLVELGQDQGLPGTEVHSIKQDTLGRLWLSTDNGVCLYDGENIYTWYKRHGLSRDVKNKLCIDRKGHIWAPGNGVDELIPEQGIVRHYGKKEGLSSNRVVGITKGVGSLLYIYTVDGVDIYDQASQTYKHIGKENGLSPGLNINSVTVDHNRRIWMASNCGGINIYDPQKERMYFLTEKQGLGNNDCRSIIAGKNNKIWMGNWNGGVDCYDPDNGLFLHLRTKNGLCFPYINDLMQDRSGIIWISCLDRGLDAYDPVTRKIQHLYGKHEIIKSTVECSLEDSQGRIWFGSNGAGLVCYDPFNGEIKNYNTFWWPSRLSIMSLMQARSGEIWLSSSGGGCCLYDPKLHTMKRLDHGKDWTNAWQMNLMEDKKGFVYFCNDYKFVISDLKTSTFRAWNVENGMPHSGMRSMAFCNDGVLIGTPKGLDKFVRAEEKFYTLKLKNDSTELSVSCLLNSDDGKTWIGTHNAGLYIFDPKTSSVVHFSDRIGVSQNDMTCLTQDKRGRIWMGFVGTGIQVLDPKELSLTTIDVKNGLTEMTVQSLIVKDEKVYAGTAKGLSVIDLSSPGVEIKNYGKTQGFTKLDFNTGTVMETTNGDIWWGIGDVMTIYKPTNKKQIPNIPCITSVDVMEKQITFSADLTELSQSNSNDTIWSSTRDTFYFSSSLPDAKKDLSPTGITWTRTEGPYRLPVDLDLPFDKDHLTFHFTGNYISNADKVRYRYVLEGLDKEWSPITKVPYVDYRNIPPGNYVFKVCSSNFGSEWSKAVSFAFTVTPPWWKTKSAYAVYVMLMIGIIYGYNRLRTNQLLKRQKELENVVDERTKDIADQKKTIEEKQKEIVDSINYAKRIQFTLLAHEKVLKKHFNDHFILFEPKDIVSGDFYWATKAVFSAETAKNKELFYLAVCDSTGHGVPGAFMSLLNISFLNEAINEKHIHEPHAILNYVRERLVTSVSRDGAKDGVDGILLCFESDNERTNYKITYAAGNNAPLLFSSGELIQQPFNKMPIGKGEKNEKFELHEIRAKKGDVLYLYTDGFADQFGGPKGKKFKYKQLNELLLNNANDLMDHQKQILSKALVDWKGNFEQVDDICLIGIRI
jgi:ligand-binding sensor domain-containing protein/serine phosphatase RsbU (regulator of sigma subunit)